MVRYRDNKTDCYCPDGGESCLTRQLLLIRLRFDTKRKRFHRTQWGELLGLQAMRCTDCTVSNQKSAAGPWGLEEFKASQKQRKTLSARISPTISDPRSLESPQTANRHSVLVCSGGISVCIYIYIYSEPGCLRLWFRRLRPCVCPALRLWLSLEHHLPLADWLTVTGWLFRPVCAPTLALLHPPP